MVSEEYQSNPRPFTRKTIIVFLFRFFSYWLENGNTRVAGIMILLKISIAFESGRLSVFSIHPNVALRLEIQSQNHVRIPSKASINSKIDFESALNDPARTCRFLVLIRRKLESYE